MENDSKCDMGLDMAVGSDLEKRLQGVINSTCRENESNTPDFILSEFMMGCLVAFEAASNKREKWFGVHLDIMNDWENLIKKAIGEASMCWSEPTKAGVFDTKRAAMIGRKLLHDIKSKVDVNYVG